MSTVVVATVKSNSSSPPAFQDTSGTEVGTLCRAWVNFNGQGTVAIRAQFNVSSITDNGAGDYTINFTNALADANYGVSFGTSSGNGRNPYIKTASYNDNLSSAALMSTSQLRIIMADAPTGGLNDPLYFCISIFR